MFRQDSFDACRKIVAWRKEYRLFHVYEDETAAAQAF
jgi:hypothetical protein